MNTESSLTKLAEDISEVIPQIDSETTGQYGDGIGSENEERQVELILESLRNVDGRYRDVEREVQYPNGSGNCDLVMSDGIPVEAKLLRYWRANGDPEDYMYTHVFSPFNKNTLMTDAKSLHESNFDKNGGLLGLLYKRADDDPQDVKALHKRFTAEDLAEKVVEDVDYWYDFEAIVCNIAKFDGLRHDVHKQGAAITWMVVE